MQWWGALTHQFQSIAASALKEVADRHSLDAGKDMAEEAIKSATEFAESAMKSVVSQRAKPAAKAAVKSKPKAQPKAPKARKAPVVARKSTARTR
jgi:TRAP-type C4-dicarboxylate transport system substrate-binding protein